MTAITSAFAQGVHASRPAAASSNAGYMYYETDTGLFYQSTGSAWQLIAPGTVAVTPSGLTGATAATRLVGGTTSGAPASGTFAVGDFIIDQTGKIWICTTAGSPGTWSQVSGGGGGGGIPALVGARAYAASPASIPANSPTKLSFDTNRFDTTSIHSTSSNTTRFTAPSAGYFAVGAFIAYTGFAYQVMAFFLEINGSTIIAANDNAASVADGLDLSVNTMWYFNSGDYVEVAAYSINASSSFTPTAQEMWMYQVGS